MPKVTGPAFSLGASKSLKKTLTFQKRPSGHAIYPWNQPGGREPHAYSPKQLAQRIAIRDLVAAWQALDSYRKADWDELAKEQGEIGTGYHKYIKLKGLYPELVWALDFDGLNDFVNIGHDVSFAGLSAERTIETWVIVQGGENTLRAIMSPPGGNFVHFQLSTDNTVGAYFYGPAKDAKSTTLFNAANYNKPFQIVATWDGTYARMFVKGVQEGISTAGAGDNIAANLDVTIGLGFGSGRPFNGLIGEVRVWDKALNVKDILIHSKKFRDISCLNTPGCSVANLKAHYKMLKGSGTVLTDFSGYGNTGTFKAVDEPKWVRLQLFKDIYGIA